MTKIFFFLVSAMFMNTAFSQSCDSTDKREMLEQLDCFCHPENKSIVKEKVDKLGNLAKTIGVSNSDCASSITTTIMLSNDKKIDSKVAEKLKSLKYSDQQVDDILKNRSQLAKNAKIISNNTCSTKSISISIWPLKYKNNQSPECEAFSKLKPEELESAQLLSMYNAFAILSKQTDFSSQLKAIEKASLLVEKYPEQRIAKCLKLTTDLAGVDSCSSSKADDEKIESCAILKMTESSSLKCLSSKADPATTKACKALNMTESSVLTCLDMAPSNATILSCKSLNMTEPSTITCLGINSDPKLISACKSLNMTESSAIKCLELKPEPALVLSCKTLNMTESSAIRCLQIGAAPEKIHQCGLKNLVESQTLDCITKAYNESVASSQVNDGQRVEKENSDQDGDSDSIRQPGSNTLGK